MLLPLDDFARVSAQCCLVLLVGSIFFNPGTIPLGFHLGKGLRTFSMPFRCAGCGDGQPGGEIVPAPSSTCQRRTPGQEVIATGRVQRCQYPSSRPLFYVGTSSCCCAAVYLDLSPTGSLVLVEYLAIGYIFLIPTKLVPLETTVHQ